MLLAGLGLLACGGDGVPVEPVPLTASVTVRTTGSTPDPDGYTLRLDDGEPVAVAIDANATLRGTAPAGGGASTVALGGLAPNCEVTSPNPAPVPASGLVTFEVACLRHHRNRILFRRVDAPQGSWLWAMNPDGTGAQGIFGAVVGGFFAVSPGGTRVAFRTLGTFAADSDHLVVLTFETGRLDTLGKSGQGGMSWAPDGRRLAYADMSSGDLRIIDRVTRESRTLGIRGASPAWSADGERIAYISAATNGIRHLRVDGSDDRPVAVGSWPSWAPNRPALAYIDHAGPTILLRTGPGFLEPTPVVTGTQIRHFSWSPDGASLVFTDDSRRVETVRVDGSDRRTLLDLTGTVTAAVVETAWVR